MDVGATGLARPASPIDTRSHRSSTVGTTASNDSHSRSGGGGGARSGRSSSGSSSPSGSDSDRGRGAGDDGDSDSRHHGSDVAGSASATAATTPRNDAAGASGAASPVLPQATLTQQPAARKRQASAAAGAADADTALTALPPHAATGDVAVPPAMAPAETPPFPAAVSAKVAPRVSTAAAAETATLPPSSSAHTSSVGNGVGAWRVHAAPASVGVPSMPAPLVPGDPPPPATIVLDPGTSGAPASTVASATPWDNATFPDPPKPRHPSPRASEGVRSATRDHYDIIARGAVNSHSTTGPHGGGGATAQPLGSGSGGRGSPLRAAGGSSRGGTRGGAARGEKAGHGGGGGGGGVASGGAAAHTTLPPVPLPPATTATALNQAGPAAASSESGLWDSPAPSTDIAASALAERTPGATHAQRPQRRVGAPSLPRAVGSAGPHYTPTAGAHTGGGASAQGGDRMPVPVPAHASRRVNASTAYASTRQEARWGGSRRGGPASHGTGASVSVGTHLRAPASSYGPRTAAAAGRTQQGGRSGMAAPASEGARVMNVTRGAQRQRPTGGTGSHGVPTGSTPLGAGGGGGGGSGSASAASMQGSTKAATAVSLVSRPSVKAPDQRHDTKRHGPKSFVAPMTKYSGLNRGRPKLRRVVTAEGGQRHGPSLNHAPANGHGHVGGVVYGRHAMAEAGGQYGASASAMGQYYSAAGAQGPHITHVHAPPAPMPVPASAAAGGFAAQDAMAVGRDHNSDGDGVGLGDAVPPAGAVYDYRTGEQARAGTAGTVPADSGQRDGGPGVGGHHTAPPGAHRGHNAGAATATAAAAQHTVTAQHSESTARVHIESYGGFVTVDHDDTVHHPHTATGRAMRGSVEVPHGSHVELPEAFTHGEVGRWLRSYSMEQAQTADAYVALQRIADYFTSFDDSSPRAERVAKALELFGQVVNVFDRYSVLGRMLMESLVAAIYKHPAAALEAATLPSDAIAADPQLLAPLYASLTYFDECRSLSADKALLTGMLKTMAGHRLKQSMAIEKTGKIVSATATRWQVLTVEAYFRAWRNMARTSRVQRNVIWGFLEVHDKHHVKEWCFRAWRLLVEESKTQVTFDSVAGIRIEKAKLDGQIGRVQSKMSVLEQERVALAFDVMKRKQKLNKILAKLKIGQIELSHRKETVLRQMVDGWMHSLRASVNARVAGLRVALGALEDGHMLADPMLLLSDKELGKVLSADFQAKQESRELYRRAGRKVASKLPWGTALPGVGAGVGPGAGVGTDCVTMPNGSTELRGGAQLCVRTLTALPLDIVVLRWMNLQFATEDPPVVVENFSGDLADSVELALLLHRLTNGHLYHTMDSAEIGAKRRDAAKRDLHEAAEEDVAAAGTAHMDDQARSDDAGGGGGGASPTAGMHAARGGLGSSGSPLAGHGAFSPGAGSPHAGTRLHRGVGGISGSHATEDAMQRATAAGATALGAEQSAFDAFGNPWPRHQRQQPKGLSNEDVEARADEVIDRMEAMGCPPLLSSHHIVHGTADMLLAAMVFLMTHFPGLRINAFTRRHFDKLADGSVPDVPPLKTTHLKIVGTDGFLVESSAADEPEAPQRLLSDRAALRKYVNAADDELLADPRTIRRCSRALEQWRSEWVNMLGSYSIDPDKMMLSSISNTWKGLSAVEAIVTRAQNLRVVRREMWRHVRAHLQGAAMLLYTRRAAGKPIHLIDHKQVRERKAFTHLDWSKLGYLRETFGTAAAGENEDAAFADQIHQVEIVLEKSFDDLKRIFRHYCSSDAAAGVKGKGAMRVESHDKGSGGAATMEVSEFWAFARDCGLVGGAPGSGTLSVDQVNEVFMSANVEDVGVHGDSAGAGGAKALNPDLELVANEWVECLVRLAPLKYRDTLRNLKVGPGGDGDGGKAAIDDAGDGPTLASLVKRLLHEDVFPNAVASHAHSWRESLRRSDVKAVFKKHRVGLQRIYVHYAGRNNSLSNREFLTLLRHCQLLDQGAFSAEQLVQLFGKIQSDADLNRIAVAGEGTGEVEYVRTAGFKPPPPTPAGELSASDSDEDEDGDGGGGGGGRRHRRRHGRGGRRPSEANASEIEADVMKQVLATVELDQEISYPEFLEGLAAIAVYKHADPYRPLASRIDAFIGRDIIGTLSFRRTMKKRAKHGAT